MMKNTERTGHSGQARTMHTFQNDIVTTDSDYAPALKFIPDHALFFDIETTGFSPKKARVYLIGTACLQGSKLITEQFFADTIEDEPEVLSAFLRLCSQFDTLISFHGLGFDIPFLQKRCEKFSLELVYHNKNYVDLYQTASNYKHIFQLENYKQKTIERFFGISREDLYNGGDLIQIYKEYTKKPDTDPSLLRLLLLHNQEDVLGMVKLLSLYAYDRLWDGDFKPVGCSRSNYRRLDGIVQEELTISCQLKEALPAAVSCKDGYFYLHAAKTEAVFCIQLLEGTLKYFYPNYKDYYYLPAEDTAVHKSVAAFVAQPHRQKAAANTCYTKKTGVFLPQYREIQTPVFYEKYKDTVSYFELPSTDTAWIKNYCMHILAVLKSGKK